MTPQAANGCDDEAIPGLANSSLSARGNDNSWLCKSVPGITQSPTASWREKIGHRSVLPIKGDGQKHKLRTGGSRGI